VSENWSRRMLDVGDRLAGFEVESFVARGGMAVVYRARDLSLERTVALKVIAPELASHDKFRQRFMRESELAASIDHPNIIPIYAAGEEDRLLYLVMRYVPGDDLGTVIKERTVLRPREALPLFTQVAGALDAAHARQLVHRDVKPGNILLSGDDDLAQRHVYLSDFGLTKRLSSLTGFTTTGHFLGTIQYVAPEQVANRAVDHRSDIYSLGCVFYEALAGEPPFVREDDAALLWSHMTQEAPLISSRRSDLPSALDPIFARALSKDPDERPVNCRTLVSQVRQAFRSPSRNPAVITSERAPQKPEAGRSGPTGRQTIAAPELPKVGSRSPSSSGAGAGRARTAPSARSVASQEPGTGRAQPRRRVPLVAGVVACALVASLLAWFLVERVWGWQEYSGLDHSEAGVSLEHPRSWEPMIHNGQFAVIAPVNLTSPFTPAGKWDVARQAVESDPDQLTGAYVATSGWLTPTPLDPLERQVRDRFKTSATVEAEERQPPGAPDGSAGGLVGTMVPLDGGAPTLYFELIALKSASRTGVVMVFCEEGDKAKHAATFKRVLESAKLR
jgi:serine/threonine protein kinase